MSMNFKRKLPIPMEIKEQFPLTAKMAEQKDKNDIEIKNNAIENFSTELGSFDLRLRLRHKIDIKGASVIINKGFND